MTTKDDLDKIWADIAKACEIEAAKTPEPKKGKKKQKPYWRIEDISAPPGYRAQIAFAWHPAHNSPVGTDGNPKPCKSQRARIIRDKDGAYMYETFVWVRSGQKVRLLKAINQLAQIVAMRERA